MKRQNEELFEKVLDGHTEVTTRGGKCLFRSYPQTVIFKHVQKSEQTV